MRQTDLVQNIKDSLTHPCMADWNYFPSFLAGIGPTKQLILDSCGMVPVGYWKPRPQTAMEAVIVETIPTTTTETGMLTVKQVWDAIQILKKEKKDWLDNFLTEDWKT